MFVGICVSKTLGIEFIFSIAILVLFPGVKYSLPLGAKIFPQKLRESEILISDIKSVVVSITKILLELGEK